MKAPISIDKARMIEIPAVVLRAVSAACFAFARASGLDGSAMRFNQVSDNRQADAQPGEAFAGAGILLAEAIEDARQEFSADALTGVRNFDLEALISHPCGDIDAPALGRGFIHKLPKQFGVGQSRGRARDTESSQNIPAADFPAASAV